MSITINKGSNRVVVTQNTQEVVKVSSGIKGDTGPQGPTGPQGATGTAATVTVGTVTTGAPGSAATVTNAGTSSAAVFNFLIPQGPTGATGATGPQGLPGVSGATFSVPGVLTVVSGKSRYYMAQSGTLSNVIASVGTAPTGSSIILDVKKNGTSIFASNPPTILTSTNANTSSVPTTANFSAGDYFTVDIVQIGSIVAGSDLVVQLIYS